MSSGTPVIKRANPLYLLFAIVRYGSSLEDLVGERDLFRRAAEVSRVLWSHSDQLKIGDGYEVVFTGEKARGESAFGL